MGLTENVGPGGFLKRVVVPMSNSLLIEGLTAGVRYYVTLASTNKSGLGPAAAPLLAVYGTNSTVTGAAVTSVMARSRAPISKPMICTCGPP